MGEFEQLVLLALLRGGPDTTGVGIRRRLEQATAKPVSAGAVYTALQRLEGRGFVSSRFGESRPVRGGKRPKLYTLERAGTRALSQAYERLTRMASGLEVRLADLAGDAG